MESLLPANRHRRAGIGFRAPHFAEIVATRPPVGFLEIHAENYLGEGGLPLRQLTALRAEWPISIHGVGLSLGSADGLDDRHLDRLARLIGRTEPAFVSEHLSWSVSGGVYLNDLLPVPYTDESLAVITANVARLQDRLRRRVLIENPSAYLRFRHSTATEAGFLAELADRTGCGVLFDVNNVFVTCQNLGGDPDAWIEALPAHAVEEIHLAGHCVNDADGVGILIDDHGSPVADPVWDLYERAVRQFPHAATLIEWDTNLPSLPVLVAEADEADVRRRDALTGVRYADAA